MEQFFSSSENQEHFPVKSPSDRHSYFCDNKPRYQLVDHGQHHLEPDEL